MEMQKEEAKMLQWHPAFFAEIQIELQEDAEHLIFENEHQLGTKPKEIDVLIIKKDKGRVIRKNIGRIFRQHNIVEYKSPLDYLSIDDFYKVYCLCHPDTGHSSKGYRGDPLTLPRLFVFTGAGDTFPAGGTPCGKRA